MPCCLSGVMLVVTIRPRSLSIGRPPANGAPPGAVWQAVQSPALATYSPADIAWANTRRAAIAREVEALEEEWLALGEKLEAA